MAVSRRFLSIGSYVLALAMFTVSSPVAQAQEPQTWQTFEQAVAGMKVIGWNSFGTGPGSTISNLNQLANVFDPYGIAGTTPIHYEWERYQPFNNTNFVFGNDTLDLVATVPGGLYEGGIASGQIWTKQTFQPGVTGANMYAFLVRMKIPKGAGVWPAMWLYSKQNGDSSEVDGVEFMTMQYENEYDWTSFDHGPGAGNEFYSLKTNPWVWHPGLDFSADYHDYEVIWTPSATYKYFDGKLILAQYMRWTSQGAAQLGVNLAIGSSEPGINGLIPNSYSEFPSHLSIKYIGIWAQ